jgi:hypothetical protein
MHFDQRCQSIEVDTLIFSTGATVCHQKILFNDGLELKLPVVITMSEFFEIALS